jgi:hypothetical protein
MSYIKKRADSFVSQFILDGVSNSKEVIAQAKTEVYDIDDQLDKSVFLQTVLTANEDEYQKHLKTCKQPETCNRNYEHETISYFLNQELDRIGIRSNEDQFTFEDKVIAESKLDEILSEIKKVKAEQSEEFRKIKDELEELKDLYLLGKKKWYQLLIGKGFEMVLSGVVSETIGHKIVTTVATEVPKLIIPDGFIF